MVERRVVSICDGDEDVWMIEKLMVDLPNIVPIHILPYGLPGTVNMEIAHPCTSCCLVTLLSAQMTVSNMSMFNDWWLTSVSWVYIRWGLYVVFSHLHLLSSLFGLSTNVPTYTPLPWLKCSALPIWQLKWARISLPLCEWSQRCVWRFTHHLSFADVHYYFSDPYERPPHHRFEKTSYVYLFENVEHHCSRLEIVNNAGTEYQDAFNGREWNTPPISGLHKLTFS